MIQSLSLSLSTRLLSYTIKKRKFLGNGGKVRFRQFRCKAINCASSVQVGVISRLIAMQQVIASQSSWVPKCATAPLCAFVPLTARNKNKSNEFLDRFLLLITDKAKTTVFNRCWRSYAELNSECPHRTHTQHTQSDWPFFTIFVVCLCVFGPKWGFTALAFNAPLIRCVPVYFCLAWQWRPSSISHENSAHRLPSANL